MLRRLRGRRPALHDGRFLGEETVAFLQTHGWAVKTLCVEDREVVAAKLEVEV